jgi:hypothetical protein
MTLPDDLKAFKVLNARAKDLALRGRLANPGEERLTLLERGERAVQEVSWNRALTRVSQAVSHVPAAAPHIERGRADLQDRSFVSSHPPIP